MRDKILALYDNFLGRFQFFRDFIKILIFFYDTHSITMDSLHDLDNTVELLKNTVEEQKKVIEDLIEQVNSLSPEKSNSSYDFTNTTAAEIMNKQYEQYINSRNG